MKLASAMRSFGTSLALVLSAVACADTGSNAADNEANATESADAYDFQLPAAGDKLERVDAMGIALLSTVLMNRDRTPSGEDNGNGYQNASPDVQNDPRTLIGFIHFLRALHKYWHDDLSRQGFEPCSDKVLGVIVATPCTLQHLRHDEDPSVEGPRVIDAVLPDYVTLDFDAPLRFPNGRAPWEPISDKIFALGFVKMGGKCPGLDTTVGVSEETKARVPRDADGVPVCTLETFADLPLQVAQNDRPFEKDFPYLARPWFYASQDSATPYFWPKTSRLELPE
jgi:hypothetical protein